MPSHRSPAPATSSHLPPLDGLRGLAILLVMLRHLDGAAFPGGFVGVELFFVLSGFLITRILLSAQDQAGGLSLRHFYLRRLLRLGPALLLLLLAILIVAWIRLPAPQRHDQYIDLLIAATYLTNWARAFDLHPPTLLGHTWSLAIEEQFYLLWPLALAGLRRLCPRRARLAGLVLALALVSWAEGALLTAWGASAERVYCGLDTRACALLIGCAVACALSDAALAARLSARVRTWPAAVPVGAVLALLVFTSAWTEQDHRTYIVGLLLMETVAALMLLELLFNPDRWLSRSLSWPPLVGIGRISYGLYLWHYPIFVLMRSRHLDTLSVATLGTLLALGVATLSYLLVERPLLRLKDRYPTAAEPTSP